MILRTCKQCQTEKAIDEFSNVGKRRRRVCNACRNKATLPAEVERLTAIFDGNQLQIARIQIITTHTIRRDNIKWLKEFYRHVGYEVLERPANTKGVLDGKTKIEAEAGGTDKDHHNFVARRQSEPAGHGDNRAGESGSDAPVHLRTRSAPRGHTRSDPRGRSAAEKPGGKDIPASAETAEKKRRSPTSLSQREIRIAGD